MQVDDAAVRIGELVARRCPTAPSCRSASGRPPDATLLGLTRRRGLPVWTEMFSDGILMLDQAGALEPTAPLTASFLFGSPELYGWVDGDERVRLLRTEKTNDPALIKLNRRMVSVNTASRCDRGTPRPTARPSLPMVDEPVTSFQMTAVVTEQGVAPIFGYDQRSQVHHLITHAAHPRVRAELREEAEALGLT